MRTTLNAEANRRTGWRIVVAAGALALVAGCGTEIEPAAPAELPPVAPTQEKPDVQTPAIDGRSCVYSLKAALAEKRPICVD